MGSTEYGDDLETLEQENVEIDGADGYEISFLFTVDDDGESQEVQGRWWLVADSEADVVSVIEHLTHDDSAFEEVFESIEFDPNGAR